jgi:hypothetical protein
MSKRVFLVTVLGIMLIASVYAAINDGTIDRGSVFTTIAFADDDLPDMFPEPPCRLSYEQDVKQRWKRWEKQQRQIEQQPGSGSNGVTPVPSSPKWK